jgi:hypothetical protein
MIFQPSNSAPKTDGKHGSHREKMNRNQQLAKHAKYLWEQKDQHEANILELEEGGVVPLPPVPTSEPVEQPKKKKRTKKNKKNQTKIQTNNAFQITSTIIPLVGKTIQFFEHESLRSSIYEKSLILLQHHYNDSDLIGLQRDLILPICSPNVKKIFYYYDCMAGLPCKYMFENNFSYCTFSMSEHEGVLNSVRTAFQNLPDCVLVFENLSVALPNTVPTQARQAMSIPIHQVHAVTEETTVIEANYSYFFKMMMSTPLSSSSSSSNLAAPTSRPLLCDVHLNGWMWFSYGANGMIEYMEDHIGVESIKDGNGEEVYVSVTDVWRYMISGMPSSTST